MRKTCTRKCSKDNISRRYIPLAVSKCSSTHTCKETAWAWAVTAGNENRLITDKGSSCSEQLQSVPSMVHLHWKIVYISYPSLIKCDLVMLLHPLLMKSTVIILTMNLSAVFVCVDLVLLHPT